MMIVAVVPPHILPGPHIAIREVSTVKLACNGCPINISGMKDWNLPGALEGSYSR